MAHDLPKIWTSVDRYLADLLLPSDGGLQSALESSVSAGLPSIQVSAPQGRLLYLLALIRGARRILEIGTLGGYSTICMARALPKDGKLVTLEMDPKHAQVATSNFERAGLGELIEVKVGAALETLPSLEGEAPFDMVFIDADKVSYPQYFEWSMKLTAPGSVIVGDNVVRDGAVLDPGSKDPNVQGVRRMMEMAAASDRVDATAIQMVGQKGYDGMLIAVVKR